MEKKHYIHSLNVDSITISIKRDNFFNYTLIELLIQTMDQTITVSIIIALLTFSSLVKGDCTIRDPLVGIGYHLIYGNPDGDDNLAGRDPGLKYTRQILDITYDEEKSTTINGNEICVADQATTVPLTSCSYTEETYLFSGTASYQEIFSAQVSVDSKYGKITNKV